MDDFSRPKLIWIELVDKGRFALDLNDNYLSLNGTFIMTGEDIAYISTILNNPVTSWHFNTFCISSGVGTNQWRELYVRELYIPVLNKDLRNNIAHLAYLANEEVDMKREEIIDDIATKVYQIFNLENDEIEFIESL